MGTKVKTFVGSLAGCVLFVSTAVAQTQTPSSPSTLDQALYRTLVERIQMPLAFATPDSTFALSLPTDESAAVYVRLTISKNGKVIEKLTRVNANHIAGYIAPAFFAATKDLRIDRNLLGTLSGKDTSLTLTFPLEYQCVLDTTIRASRAGAYPYRSRLFYDNVQRQWFAHNRQIQQYFPGSTIDGTILLDNPYIAQSRLPKPDSYSGKLNFYIVFLSSPQE